jgi:septal ring factor EnvC (AmiA/AmiB activator)
VIDYQETHSSDAHDTPETSFESFAHDLAAVHAHLGELAAQCRAQAEELGRREEELARREEELTARSAVIEEAERRLRETEERERRLAAFGSELLERFGDRQEGV